MRPIDADALISSVDGIDGEWLITVGSFRKIIGDAPTISPDEVRGKGKWITKENGKVWWYECSCCGTRPLKSRWAYEETLSCYCPNCGAKMEVSEDA